MNQTPLNWTIRQLVKALPEAQQLGDVSAIQAPIEQIVTDSRLARSGSVFVALIGEKYDAHDFVGQVAQQGAMLAIVSKPLNVNIPQLVVEDTKVAYGLIAKCWREQFNVPVIAVGGSNGKTTTKEMIAAILSKACGPDAVLWTQGNLNNDIGVPHTLLRLRAHHTMAVIEMGMNHPGEMQWLAHITQPTVALVNNAQREHQEFMATVEAVAQENGSVFKALNANGMAVFPANTDYNDLWKGLAGHVSTRTFGWVDADVTIASTATSGGQRIQVTCNGITAGTTLHALGNHNALNAAAAISCTMAAGLSLEESVQGISEFLPVNGRMQPVAIGDQTTLINDTYNANPDSVLAAIDVIASMAAPQILVLGDMGEVGDQGPQFHREVGLYAKQKNIHALMTLGQLSESATQAFGRGAQHFDGMETLINELKKRVNLQPLTVLVKGSRFMKMERVVQALMQDQSGESKEVTNAT